MRRVNTRSPNSNHQRQSTSRGASTCRRASQYGQESGQSLALRDSMQKMSKGFHRSNAIAEENPTQIHQVLIDKLGFRCCLSLGRSRSRPAMPRSRDQLLSRLPSLETQPSSVMLDPQPLFDTNAHSRHLQLATARRLAHARCSRLKAPRHQPPPRANASSLTS